MNVFALVVFVVCAGFLLTVDRRWAPIPLLIGCCYMTMGQGINLGPISLPIYRMLLFVGLLRMAIRGEGIKDFGNTVDKLMFALMGWIIFASFFHDGVLGSGPVYASGIVFNLSAVYFLIRAWCRDMNDVTGIVIIVAFMLAPVAAEMVMEKVTKINQFSIFGGVPHSVIFREGKFRAQGPFRHPILAGTVGAVCIPLFIGIWKKNRTASAVGIASGLCMTMASASSGPIMSVLAGLFAVGMWKFRHLTRMARIAAVVMYFLLQLVTGEPGYYMMKRIDISGGSTGYHRARLIESAFEKLGEWWLFGTDYTRHWMPTGVSFSPFHTDITNYYLAFGVVGGGPAMLLVISILIVCFWWIGIICRSGFHEDADGAFMVWCLGAGLFAHAATSVSVSYFDQSLVFFWMNVAIISAMYSGMRVAGDPEDEDESADNDHEEEDGPHVPVGRDPVRGF